LPSEEVRFVISKLVRQLNMESRSAEAAYG
jgi:hypothetical protein